MSGREGPTPLFLLSLPRSGSTLVQRVLATSGDVATTPEPWLLLPQVYARRERGAFAEYGQVPSARAIREFAERLPHGSSGYDEELRRFVVALYRRAGGEARYFLDKTPRYHHIATDLLALFPDARFVFLWRNPLAVAASIVDTWANGRWNVDRWHADLFDGLAHLVEARVAAGGGAHAVRYEDLVGDGRTEAWSALYRFLDLPFDEAALSSFAEIDLSARMGDPTGVRRYTGLSAEPLEKWTRTLRTPVRRAWARRYLAWIGDDRLAAMGYERDELVRQLEAEPTSLARTPSDVARASYARLNRTGRAAAATILWRKRPR